jgi:hypothetical protein
MNQLYHAGMVPGGRGHDPGKRHLILEGLCVVQQEGVVPAQPPPYLHIAALIFHTSPSPHDVA